MKVLTRYSKIAAPPTVLVERPRRKPDTAARRIGAVRRRLRPELIARLVSDYRAGHSTTQLMQTYGLGKGTVLSILAECDVKMRGQGIPDNRLQEAIQLYRGGLSLKAVAHRLDCSAETVRQALMAAGVTMRPGGSEGRAELRCASTTLLLARAEKRTKALEACFESCSAVSDNSLSPYCQRRNCSTARTRRCSR